MGVHHAWGRTYKDAYHRYFAMTGHELRYQNGFDCQGLWVEVEVEKELGLKSKRDIENLVPGDRVREHRPVRAGCKDRVDKFARVQTEQSIRLGYWMDWDRTDADWAKPPDERKSYFTMSEENNYTIWAFLKKCHGKRLIYRGYDAMPWCGRCGVGISEMEMNEGYKLVEHRAVFVKFPLTGPARREPARLDDDAVDADEQRRRRGQSGADVPKVKLKGEVYYVAKGAFKLEPHGVGGDGARTRTRRRPKKAKRPWLDGVPQLKTHRAASSRRRRQGRLRDRRRGEGRGHGRLGVRRPVRRPAGAAARSTASPRKSRRSSKQSGLVRRRRPRRSRTASSPGKDVTETEGTGIVHIAPGCGADRLRMGQGATACRRSRRSTTTACSSTGFGPLTARTPSTRRPPTRCSSNCKKKDRAVRDRALRPPLPALLALQDGAALPPRRRVVHQHGAAEQEEGSATRS